MSANENVLATANGATDINIREQLNRLHDVSALLASIRNLALAEEALDESERDIDFHQHLLRIAKMAKERLETTAEAMDTFLTINTDY